MNVQQSQHEIKKVKDGNLTELNLNSYGDKIRLTSEDLARLVPEIAEIKNLQTLKLWDNQISDISQISRLKELRHLDLRGNKVSDLTPLLELRNLEKLEIQGNKIIDVTPLAQLIKLQTLNLWNNQITNIAPLANIPGLENLDISENRISDISPLFQLKNLRSLDLRGNKDLEVKFPSEILHDYENPSKILEYYLKIMEGETKSLDEARIMILGQGSVGKTSLVNRLISDEYNTDERITQGINIRKDWKVKADKREIRLSVWDFGGQEIMHSTHLFFLSKRCLYILVLDSRLEREENRVDYWLEIIRIYGGNSPVIIVGNKTDQHPFDINQRALVEKYPNIKGFFPVSCETQQGLKELKSFIIKEVDGMDGIHDALPKTWFNVKKRMEALDADYVSYDTYLQICREEGVEDDDTKILIEILNDLGIVLHFSDDRRINTNVLNPTWVTRGVYKILNSRELFDTNGVLRREMLGKILDEKIYPKQKQLFLVDMMRRFGLCFEIVPDKEFLVPDLLPKEEPYTGEWNDALRFEYQYAIFIHSVITRLMVKMHEMIHKRTYWRTGMILEYEVGDKVQNHALIKADQASKVISIFIEGNEHTRREFLSIIRREFDLIHRSFASLSIREKVGHPKYANIFKDYDELILMEEDGMKNIFVKELRQSLPIKDFLNGVESIEERRQNKITEKDVYVPFIENQSELTVKSKKAELEKLEVQISKLNEILNNLDETARKEMKSYSIIILSVMILSVAGGTYLYFTVNNWSKIEVFFSIGPVIILIAAYIFSAIKAGEWSFSKIPESLYERERLKLYEKFDVDIAEFEYKKYKLNELKQEIESLKKPVS